LRLLPRRRCGPAAGAAPRLQNDRWDNRINGGSFFSGTIRGKGGIDMGLFSSTAFNSFDDLFIDLLQDMYDAEQRLTKALPLMAGAARNASLRAAFQQHLKETQNQLSRLERVFQSIGQKAQGKTCHAMKGLVEEGNEVISAGGDADVKDAGLIAAAQKVEHYEIACYGTARTFAQRLGHHEAARLLQETLQEEEATDKKLTALAEQSINPKAAMATS
jgi:ferritin-like metal-binding protein YciE